MALIPDKCWSRYIIISFFNISKIFPICLLGRDRVEVKPVWVWPSGRDHEAVDGGTQSVSNQPRQASQGLRSRSGNRKDFNIKKMLKSSNKIWPCLLAGWILRPGSPGDAGSQQRTQQVRVRRWRCCLIFCVTATLWWAQTWSDPLWWASRPTDWRTLRWVDNILLLMDSNVSNFRKNCQI